MNKIIFILTIFCLFVSKSFACDCVGPSTDIEENWKKVDHIFIGQVIKSSTDELHSATGMDFTFYTVEVVDPIKGNFHRDHKMRTFEKVGNGSCDFPFEVGKKYLIYANRSNHILEAHICSRTAALDEVEKSEIEELKRLVTYYGEERVPTVKIEKNSTEEELETANAVIAELESSKKWLIGISIALGLLLVLSIIKMQKRK